ncbi:hypothetical protein SAMN05216368_11361 [Cryobacterium flavum]|uniref:DUF4232 domain-containing protein n=1 Tax=Cryobacterium flavum TaxID=1424659 RepID=A0A4R8V5I7_9MICO|nr:hypothetical protein [Cryobacterium flavum]TFB78002.1 hypothetical protein E3O21_06975 [Cryobacterium flavum]SDO25208.1 hypothetical protein SAMN05216368_11361 [Cryobacterium flavum]
MSTIKQPVGRQSSKVYRRRRFVVGLGLLAVLVILFLIIVQPGVSKGDGDSPKTPAADTTESAAPTDAATTIPEVATAVDGAACDPSAVQVAAVTDATNYAVGVLPQLSLSLTNIGTTDCVINAGNAKQVFTVMSGQDVYWTSTDCQTNPIDAQVTLKPGVVMPLATPITWDRTRSAVDTCQAETRTAVPAGGASYYLHVTVDGIEAADPALMILN